MKRSDYIWPLLTLAGITILGYICYFPGLRGGFLFDDFANLPSLGATGPVKDWAAAARYLTSGTADPLGRPIALLSFLIDAQSWPADPKAFLKTNITLHLLNGVLLACLLRELMRISSFAPGKGSTLKPEWIAVLGSALWLLHPFFVSTTLYIVQREAMLAGTFTFLGLVFWLKGRHALERNNVSKGVALIFAGFLPCIAFAALSKANGILLPALALIIEYIAPTRLLRDDLNEQALPCITSVSLARKVYRLVFTIFCALPTLLIISYLGYRGWIGLIHGLSFPRPWTLTERLLTEPRILIDYIRCIWFPRLYTHGLFNDQIKASTSLWSPITTLPSILAIAALIWASWKKRKQYAAWSLTILFFFVAQSMESTTLPLELYFEHRNYVPAALMFWPLSIWLMTPSKIHEPSSSNEISHHPHNGTPFLPLVKAALAIVLISGLGLMTYLRASSWGEINSQAIHWAELNPASPRAQANAAQAEMDEGLPQRAQARLESALVKAPHEVQLALNLFAAECQIGHVSSKTLLMVNNALRTTGDPGSLLISWFERALDSSSLPTCKEDSTAELRAMLSSALKNHNLMSEAGRRQDIYYLFGRLSLSEGHPDEALVQFNHALDQQVRIEFALQQAALLGSHNYPEQALAHLDYYAEEKHLETAPDIGMPRIHQWVLQRQGFWQMELAHLRGTLLEDIKAKQSQGKHA